MELATMFLHSLLYTWRDRLSQRRRRRLCRSLHSSPEFPELIRKLCLCRTDR